jgi:hypothetical protein
MSRLDRRAHATFALVVLAGLGSIASGDAQGENSWQRHEHPPAERGRQAARREPEVRQSRGTRPTHPQGVHTAARWDAPYAHEHPLAMRETHPAGAGQVREVPHGLAGAQVRVVRYGNTLNGTVERTIRPGLISRTFVSGGHALYTHVYQRHVWHQFGRAFAYETFVPAVRYPPVYYAWALAAWPRPVTYTWGWQVQPWYPMYGSLFTPYPVYTSPDLWMTDYIIAQSMQTAYQAQTPAPASEPSPQGALGAPAPEPGGAAPAVPPSEQASPPEPSGTLPAPKPSNAPSAPVALPPVMTPEVKAQLNSQIKVQLQEQQTAAATPAVLTTQSIPPALRPSHVFFQVVQPLDVPSGTANRYCSLSPNDYIKRTGGISNDDWMIPVVVELSGPADCPKGLQTRIGLNDLNAMENEQEAQVMEAMQAASKSMGPNGPPSGVHPTLIADGSAAPDPGALDAIRQAQ